MTLGKSQFPGKSLSLDWPKAGVSVLFCLDLHLPPSPWPHKAPRGPKSGLGSLFYSAQIYTPLVPDPLPPVPGHKQLPEAQASSCFTDSDRACGLQLSWAWKRFLKINLNP